VARFFGALAGELQWTRAWAQGLAGERQGAELRALAEGMLGLVLSDDGFTIAERTSSWDM
jgi:hypothetical protein